MDRAAGAEKKAHPELFGDGADGSVPVSFCPASGLLTFRSPGPSLLDYSGSDEKQNFLRAS